MGLESPIGGECALLLLFLSLLFTIVAYIVYSGLLAPVEVSALSPPFEPSVFAYKVYLILATCKTLARNSLYKSRSDFLILQTLKIPKVVRLEVRCHKWALSQGAKNNNYGVVWEKSSLAFLERDTMATLWEEKNFVGPSI